MSIKKILVANRGEIAIRVMRSVCELGIKTVAVYSEADKFLSHPSYADEAVHIGLGPASDSYLMQDKIIDACKQTGADAIHPGYGFLSENASFAKRVEEEGLIFIGPSPEAIRIMGDKLISKKTIQKYGIPLVPGMDEPINNVTKAKEIAHTIGYPIMIKASAGGGGKGMRIVDNSKDFEEQMNRAMSEARNSFGNDEVFIEKYISSPKHIEVQILGDKHGNIVHLFERECSIQRRHQKVIEEAPSPVITPEKRMLIGEAAVKVAQSCHYYSAGTVEFIVDKNLDFYFLEMNTRLQVEHPVTELITGVDLVKEQINIANGQKLSFNQSDLTIKGHSLEARIYAEDPENNFLPDIGTLHTYIRPQGVGIRVDDGYEEGQEISIYYDPMIAKLIVYGKDRTEAIERMKRAIYEYQISGVKTTLPFCEYVLNHKDFIDGTFTTKFVEKNYNPQKLKKIAEKETLEVVAVIANQLINDEQIKNEPKTKYPTQSKWKGRTK